MITSILLILFFIFLALGMYFAYIVENNFGLLLFLIGMVCGLSAVAIENLNEEKIAHKDCKAKTTEFERYKCKKDIMYKIRNEK